MNDTSMNSAAKVKAMKDRIMKTITEINKVQKQANKAKEQADNSEKQVEKLKTDIQTAITKKNLLNTMS